MSLIERDEAIIHDWTCGCGKGQACPNRDGCREAAEQIAADPATGAVSLSDHERHILRQWGCAIRELDGERFSDEERTLLDRLGAVAR